MSPAKDSDDPIKIGADLLLKGWVMLNKACPKCYQPLYKKEGRVVCVKCKQDYIITDSPTDLNRKKEEEVANAKSQATQPLSTKSNLFDFSSLPPALVESAKTLMEKLSILNTRLKETSDPKEIAEISNSIRAIVESLRTMSS